MCLVSQRQKLVKLTNSAQLGWKGVQKYEAHSIAEDNDDRKRMLKAERSAKKKGPRPKKVNREGSLDRHCISGSAGTDNTSKEE